MVLIFSSTILFCRCQPRRLQHEQNAVPSRLIYALRSERTQQRTWFYESRCKNAKGSFRKQECGPRWFRCCFRRRACIPCRISGIQRSCGLTDKASVSGTEDCGFESHQGRLHYFCQYLHFLFIQEYFNTVLQGLLCTYNSILRLFRKNVYRHCKQGASVPSREYLFIFCIFSISFDYCGTDRYIHNALLRRPSFRGYPTTSAH